MDLRKYLFETRISVTEFSDKIGYTRAHISRIVHGKAKPSARLAKDIEKATDGKVKIKDLLGDK